MDEMDMLDEMDMRRRRALYRAQHRGTKELDIVLSRFALARLDEMTAEEMSSFEEFLALPEPQIDDWVMKAKPVAQDAFAQLVADVRKLSGFE